MTVVSFEEQVEIPMDLRSLAQFRHWAASHHRGSAGFVPVKADPEGFQYSQVFDKRMRLERVRDDMGLWCFQLIVRDAHPCRAFHRLPTGRAL